jgi:hypothetical protein
MQENTCKQCGTRFGSRQELDRHNETAHMMGRKGGEEMSNTPPKGEQRMR